ncbi:MAG: transposase [Candidatus Bathyarchaeia archaeon]
MSLLKLHRTIHAKLILDREGKREAVEREYYAWQRQLNGKDEVLYSASKQQAERFKQRVKNKNRRGLKAQEYPMILRRDCVKVQHQKDSVFKWWIRIPISPKSIWIPIQLPHEQEPVLKHELHECKLLHGEKGEWYVNITVQKQARLKRKYTQLLPVDMGVRKLATTIEKGRPQFYGKEVRAIRGHYFHLRRSVGKPRIIKKWKHRERRIVRHEVHAITRRIVDHAKEMNAVIVVGDLRGIRNQNKGRGFNRRLSGQPFYLFKQQLTYKANWEGIRVLTVSEAYTSQLCSRCGVMGQRVAGRFSCQDCGLRVDADVNGAWNIGKRAHGLLAHDAGGSLIIPRTLAVCEP